MIKAIVYTRTIGSQDKAVYSAHTVANIANKHGIEVIKAITEVAPGYNIDRLSVEDLLHGVITEEFNVILVENINSITIFKDDQTAFLKLIEACGGMIAEVTQGSIEVIHPTDINVREENLSHSNEADEPCEDCDSYKEIFDILEKLFGGNCHENC